MAVAGGFTEKLGPTLTHGCNDGRSSTSASSMPLVRATLVLSSRGVFDFISFIAKINQ